MSRSKGEAGNGAVCVGGGGGRVRGGAEDVEEGHIFRFIYDALF